GGGRRAVQSGGWPEEVGLGGRRHSGYSDLGKYPATAGSGGSRGWWRRWRSGGRREGYRYGRFSRGPTEDFFDGDAGRTSLAAAVAAGRGGGLRRGAPRKAGDGGPGCGRYQAADRPPQTRVRRGLTGHHRPHAGAAGNAGG